MPQDQVNRLYLYDEIGPFGIDAKTMVELLADIQGPVAVHFNSPGGDVYEALTMIEALRRHDGPTEAVVDALAASAASLLAVTMDRVTMAHGAFMMIHEPWSVAMGNSDRFRFIAERLDATADRIGNIYAEAAGVSHAQAMAWLTDGPEGEMWFNADQAVEVGLADDIVSHDLEIAANIGRFQWHYPKNLQVGRYSEPITPEARADALKKGVAIRKREMNRYRLRQRPEVLSGTRSR